MYGHEVPVAPDGEWFGFPVVFLEVLREFFEIEFYFKDISAFFAEVHDLIDVVLRLAIDAFLMYHGFISPYMFID